MEFFDTAFWKDFASNVLATLLGVAVGIPVALWIDRFVSRRRESKEIAERRNALTQRKNQFLQMLHEALRKNLALVEQMERELRPESVIFYNVDTQLLESTSSMKNETIEDLDLNRRLDSIRYELLHLHRKVELQLEIEYSPYKAMANYMDRRAQLVEAITAHFPRIKQEIREALAIIAVALPNEA
ncbi:MAG: hypothetical protein JRJ38_16715 [Deltaproteobacteria bacterium]|nr:hypothetical protein [Deltaproteobacteria bacterium]